MDGGEECVTGVAGDSAHPLLRAVYLRRLRLTRLLLEGGAYINESDRHGQTPLMVACRTQHADGQSAGRAKLLKYLLERGADPNIQDQDGRSALMHACREHAGPEPVGLLLAGGADLGLEDRSGTSALVYAVTAGDQKVLRLLLDAYKSQGKEVIIITTDGGAAATGSSRRPWARQHRHGLAPHLALDTRTCQAPASPSEIQIITSPLGTGPGGAHRQVFSFRENQCSACSGGQPWPPGPGQGRPGWAQQQQPLLRLNSEPWLKIPASSFHQEPSENERNAGDHHHHLDWGYGARPVSQVSLAPPRGPGHTLPDATGHVGETGRGHEGGGEGAGDLQRGHHTIALPGISSPHSASHPNLHTAQHQAASPGTALSTSTSFPSGRTPGAALSGLDSIIQRRRLGADHYASDPQLTLKTVSLEEPPDRARPPAECRRMAALRSVAPLGSGPSSGSRETQGGLGPGPGPGPGPMARRALPGFERRGSGAFLLDQASGQYHPRSLPPLNLYPQCNSGPVPPGTKAAQSSASTEPCEKTAGLKTFLPCAPPGHPKEVTRRALMRRHSMQSEQLKTA